MPSKLEKALRRQDRDKLDKKTELAGTMGVVLNGVATVEVPNRAGFVYVLLNTKEQELIQAFNDKVSGLFGLAVIVVWNVNRYEVLRKDDLRYGTFNSNYLPKHGNQHSFNPDGGGGGDVTFIYGKQFVPLSLTPSGTFGAPVAIVAPYSQLNSGWHYIPSTPTPNITAHKPTDNQARMVLVAMDWNTRTPQLIIGTGTFAANLTGSADVIPYLPSPTGVMQIPIAGVRLVSGTSAVTWQNIYDVRQFFHPIFTGTSSGGGGGTGTASSTSFAVFGNTISPNDSVTNTSTVDPLTLGDTFFNDSNICTLSGNTLTFNVAGWFRIHTTIYATTLTTFGNGKIYAFVDTTAASPAWVPDYDYLTAADSSKNQIDFDFDGTIEVVEGDTIKIGVTNQTGGNIFASVLEVRIETLAGGAGSVTINRNATNGVVGWDEGIFLGTGTVFNFVGENVQATISGSVVRVFVTGSTGGGSVDTGTLDARYLKLDTSNDPLTGRLVINPTIDGLGQFGTYIQILDTASPYTPAGLGILNKAGETIYATTEAGRPAAILNQTPHTGTVVSQPVLSLNRNPYSTPTDSPSFTEALIKGTQLRGTGTISGGFLKFVSDNVTRVDVNPSVQGTGTAVTFDTDFQLSPNGMLLSLKNQGVSRMYVNASGTVFSNGEPLIKEAPTDGNAYLRQNAGWVSATGVSVQSNVQASVAVQDEGVPLGTGTVFNFVGNGIDASISGSVVRVFSSGSIIADQNHYLAAYNYFIGSGNVGYRVGIASSPDMRNWKIRKEPSVDIGAGGAWDDTTIQFPRLVRHNGVLYCFYSGKDAFTWSNFKIGVAISNNEGFNFNKYGGNPILSPSQAWENSIIFNPVVYYDKYETNSNAVWKMWYAGSSFGEGIGYAYAPSPTGTWTKWNGNPVVSLAPAGQWDDAYISPQAVIRRTDGTYILFYAGNNGSSQWQSGYVTFTNPTGTYTRSSYNPILRSDGIGTTLTSNLTIGTKTASVANSNIFPIGCPVWIGYNNRFLTRVVDRPTSTTVALADAAPFTVSSGDVIYSASKNSLDIRGVLYDNGFIFPITAHQPDGGTEVGVHELSMIAYADDNLQQAYINYGAGVQIPVTLAESQNDSVSRENWNFVDMWEQYDKMLPFPTGSAGNTTNNITNITNVNTSLSVQENGVFVASGTVLNFAGNVDVSVSGAIVQVFAPVTTYFRVGVPTQLSGNFYRVPDGVYASGSLGVFNNGLALLIGTDYAEQLWVSGTYQYLSNRTGTHLVHYGVPCSPQIQPSTGTGGGGSAFDLQDSDSVLLQDSDGIQLLDSDG